MPLVTFDELIRNVPLSVEDAAALTLGASDALQRRAVSESSPALPADAELTLAGDGTVSLRSVDRRQLPDHVPQLAALLRRLLRLDDDAAGSRRSVPGALVVLIARSVGHIDVPPPSLDAFRTSLLRFVGNEPEAVRAAVFHRATPAPATASAPATAAAVLMPTPLPTPLPTPEPVRAQVGETTPKPSFVIPRRPAPRKWMARGAQAALAISGAVVTTLVLVTLAEQGFLDRKAAASGDTVAPATIAAASPAPATAPVAGTTGRTAPHLESAASARIVPSRGGAPAEILTAGLVGRDAFSPSYTRRGNAIYFHAGREKAALMRAAIDADGRVTDVVTVLDDGASNYHVVASPDGRQLAFDSDRDGVRGVYVARPDGSAARRVSGAGYAAVPSWSPDGRRLAFIKSEPGRRNVWNIWVADLPRGALHKVTTHTTGQAWGASWFPDGHRIAYSRERQLVIADLTTGNASAIGSPIPGRLVRTPAVSPDGSRVIFQVQGDGAWMLDVARQRVRRVLADRSAEEFVWSPDGHRIAYHAVRNGAWSVWTMASGA